MAIKVEACYIIYYYFAVSLLSEFYAKAFLEFCIIRTYSRKGVVKNNFMLFIRTLHFPRFDSLKDLLGLVARSMQLALTTG